MPGKPWPCFYGVMTKLSSGRSLRPRPCLRIICTDSGKDGEKLGISAERIRKIITDRIWEKLEVALATAKHSVAGAPPKLSDRDFLEALLYLNRTGTPWRDLPSELGAWDVVYMRFRRWTERGVWQRLWQDLQTERFADARDLLLDSTTVRAHPHAAGAPKERAMTKLWGGLAGALPQKSMPPPSMKTARSRSM